jgi:hypothetical protein
LDGRKVKITHFKNALTSSKRRWIGFGFFTTLATTTKKTDVVVRGTNGGIGKERM